MGRASSVLRAALCIEARKVIDGPMIFDFHRPADQTLPDNM
jgi:hypothetical protein